MKPFAKWAVKIFVIALIDWLASGTFSSAQIVTFSAGMEMDEEGNIYIATRDTIYEVYTDGAFAEVAAMPAATEILQAAVDANGNIFIASNDGKSIEINVSGDVTDLSGEPFPGDALPLKLFSDAAGFEDASQLANSGVYASNLAWWLQVSELMSGEINSSSGSTDTSITGGADTGAVDMMQQLPPPSTATSVDQPLPSTPSSTKIPAVAAAAPSSTFSFIAVDQNHFFGPGGVAVDAQGNVYVADTGNNRVCKLTPLGVVTTLSSVFANPEAVAVDAQGNVYVADTFNDRIAKIAVGTNHVTFIGDDNVISFPTGVAVDSAGNVFVADPGNHIIVKITPANVTTVFAGISEESGDKDGAGSVAQFNNPTGIAIDKSNNLYVADTGNLKIRKITSRGVVSTVKTTLTFDNPVGVAVDPTGDIFVVDNVDDVVYEITPKASFLVGGQVFNGFGNDGTYDEASFDAPLGIAATSTGDIYVADTDADAIRAGLLNHPLSYLTKGSFQIGDMVALQLGDATGTQFYYYSIANGQPADLIGEDSNIVKFTGGGKLSVGFGVFHAQPGGQTGWEGHQIHQGDPAIQPGQPGSANSQKIAQLMNGWVPIGTHVFGDAPFTVTPPAPNDSSGIPVVVAVKSGPATISGNTVTLTGIGTVALMAGQSGNTTYNASPFVATTFPVGKGTAQIHFSNLNATYDGNPHGASVTTTPSGLSVSVTYGRSTTAPTLAGTYAVTATVSNPNYTGSGTASLVIAKAAATVHLSTPTVVYDGKVHAATATTTPANLPVTFTYGGSTKAPLHAGTYTVVATINSPNAQGTASQTLTIARASATVTVASKTVPYSGRAVTLTATTTPPKLTTTLTYNGSSTAPSGVGVYTVSAVISNPDYNGSGSGTLTISAIAPTATTGVASAIQSTQATVSATINPEDAATTVLFHYGTSKTSLTLTKSGTSVAAGTTSVASTATLINLTPGTIYFYTVTATNVGGTSKTGAMKTFKTLP